MKKDGDLDEYFRAIIDAGIFSNNIKFYLRQLFKGTCFANKAVLDIGGGNGWISYYSAFMGAESVTCLEPEQEGSSREVKHVFEKLRATFSVHFRVSFEPRTILEYHPDGRKFDIIILHNSINHLDETACMNLLREAAARERYELIFRKLLDLSSEEAEVLIVDASRYNFFSLCRLKNPFVPSIEWNKHQSPQCWARLLSTEGFSDPKIRWLTLNRLGNVGKLLFANGIAAYFFHSYFCLRMKKRKSDLTDLAGKSGHSRRIYA